MKMTEEQVVALTRLCERFEVPFVESNFFASHSCGEGWVEGQVGPIFVGCSPEGNIHS
jgi:hypothetical protein